MTELQEGYANLMKDVEARVEELASLSARYMADEDFNLTGAQAESLRLIGAMVLHYENVRRWLQISMELCDTKGEPGLAQATRDQVKLTDQAVSFRPANR